MNTHTIYLHCRVLSTYFPIHRSLHLVNENTKIMALRRGKCLHEKNESYAFWFGIGSLIERESSVAVFDSYDFEAIQNPAPPHWVFKTGSNRRTKHLMDTHWLTRDSEWLLKKSSCIISANCHSKFSLDKFCTSDSKLLCYPKQVLKW